MRSISRALTAAIMALAVSVFLGGCYGDGGEEEQEQADSYTQPADEGGTTPAANQDD